VAHEFGCRDGEDLYWIVSLLHKSSKHDHQQD
jgi:hypothetical protein